MSKLRPLWMICEEMGIDEHKMWEEIQSGRIQNRNGYTCVEDIRTDWIKNGILRKAKAPHSLVTISLPKEKYSNNFSDEIKGCLNRNTSMLNNNEYMFSLEFYGKSEEIHPHAHILIKGGGLDKSKIIRAFSRSFKIEKNFIDIQRSEDEQLYLKRIDYVKGIKKNEKMELVKKDEEFRELHRIKKYYESI